MSDINVLESDIEDVVEQMFFRDKELLPWQFSRNDFVIRQLSLGGYGTLDLVMFKFDIENKKDDDGHFVRHIDVRASIIELKRDEINIDTFSQAARYKKGLNLYVNFLSGKFKKDTYINISSCELILVGKTIDKTHQSFCYLTDIFRDIHFFTYKIGIKGFYLNQEKGYELTGNNFSRNYKDIAKCFEWSDYSKITNRYL